MLLARGAHTNTTDHRISLSRKPNSGTGVEKIVAARFGKIEKLGSHERANRITTDPGVAAAIAIKPCRWFD
jgi:hypothetical protein